MSLPCSPLQVADEYSSSAIRGVDISPCIVAAAHPECLSGLVVVDPLGAVGDGGESDMGRIMDERIPPEAAARAAELDERAMRGEGTAGDAMEALSIVWPAYFATPEQAPPMPDLALSLVCYSETWESIHRELAAQTLATLLAGFRAPRFSCWVHAARSRLDTASRRPPSSRVPRPTSSPVAVISRGWIVPGSSERRSFLSNPGRRIRRSSMPTKTPTPTRHWS